MSDSKTEKVHIGGLTGMIMDVFAGGDEYYETTITDNSGNQYVGTGKTPEESQSNAKYEHEKSK